MKIRGQTVYSPQDRIKRLSIVDEQSGCWNWAGSTTNGYGRLITGSRTNGTRKSMTAHRYSYLSFNGEIKDSLFVCHKCDNKKCVNPSHLFLGTHQDNIDDREAKGRNNHVTGERVASSKLTVACVISAKRLRAKGLTFQAIADRFEVGKSAVMRAIKGETWKSPLPGAPA